MRSNKTEIIDRCYKLLTILATPHSAEEIAAELDFSPSRGAARSAGRYLKGIQNHPELRHRLKFKVEKTKGRPKKMWWIDYME